MKTAFVTGSTGLLGNNLVKHLLLNGYSVRALVRDAEKARQQFKSLDVEVIIGDILQADGFATAMQGCDVLFHTAAYFRDSYSGGTHTEQLQTTNVQGTQQLMSAAYAAGIRRMVHTSSIAVLGHKENGLIDENHLQHDLSQVDDYYRSKIESDRQVTAFLETHPDMWAAFVLPGWMHGPGDIGPTSAGQFVIDYMRGKIPGVIDSAFSLVDARDVAAISLAVAESGGRGERYLAAGQAMGMSTLLAMMEKISGRPAPTRALPRRLIWLIAAAHELYSRITGKPVLISLAMVNNLASDYGRRFSAEKVFKEFGLEFRPAEQTLTDELHWYQQHGWL